MGVPSSRKATFVALVFACVFPTIMAWTYFLLLPTGEGKLNPLQQTAYSVGKVVQFAFPFVFLWLTEGCPGPRGPPFRGLRAALAFGLAVTAAMLGLYFLVLRHTALFDGTSKQVLDKLNELGVATPGRYLALAAFVVVAHSLMEEYYWRWF